MESPGHFAPMPSSRCGLRQSSEPARLRPSAVAETLRASQFDTILGRVGFDPKGDVTGANTFVWYVWKGGELVPLEEASAND